MDRVWPRFLLALASTILTAGVAVHAAAFNKVVLAVRHSNLPDFYGRSLKMLWLADSATLLLFAGILVLFAVRPALASRPVLLLLAILPAASAALLYAFLGNFFPGHLLTVVSGAVFIAGLRFPQTRRADGSVT
jgi:uncharacterized membrane protein